MRRCIGFVLFIGSLLCGQPRIDTSRADAIAAAQHKQQKVAGLAVGVVTRDGAYRQGYGVRSLDSSFQGRPYGHRSAPPACRAVRDRRTGRGDAWGSVRMPEALGRERFLDHRRREEIRDAIRLGRRGWSRPLAG